MTTRVMYVTDRDDNIKRMRQYAREAAEAADAGLYAVASVLLRRATEYASRAAVLNERIALIDFRDKKASDAP